MITTTAMKCGFSGGVIVDFPNSAKAKKLYLVINAGGDNRGEDIVLIEGKNSIEEDDEAKFNPLDKLIIFIYFFFLFCFFFVF